MVDGGGCKMANPFHLTGSPIVDRMCRLQFTGNVIPAAWYRTITRDNGKPNLTAIIILSDVVYWYRPVEIRDELTGQLCGFRKKFKADILQRNYQQLADQFGISKREAVNAVVELEKIGVVRRVFRTVRKGGMRNSNVLFLELNVDVLIQLTYPENLSDAGYHFLKGELSPHKERGATSGCDRISQSNEAYLSFEGDTNTEITEENTDIEYPLCSYQAVERAIRIQISYDALKNDHPYDRRVEEILGLILDVMVSTAPKLRINREEKDIEIVKAQFAKLTKDHVEFVLQRDWLINLDRNSLILDEEVYKRCLNLNTLNEQNLRDCEYMVVPWRKSEESLFSKPRVFEELKVLYNVKAVYIDLYDRLAYSKSDDRLRVIRELIKRDCLTDALEENQVERLAEALSKKPLSRWMQEDFKNILDLRHETAIWILIFLMNFTELLKELTRDNQVYFLLHNQNLLNGCSGLPALMDKLLAQDPSWKNLKTELNISDAFVVENKSNIQKFIYEGGAEIMTSFLNRQPKKKEEIRRIVNAELLGKFMELKYHGGDLGREIAFPIKRDTEEIWKEKLLRVDCGWEIWEEDSLLPVMQIGEVPLRSCISYRNGPNCDCLLSCFDANKKIIFIKHNGKIVFRAILRLTKGSFVAADERKTIEFVDVTVKSEPHENKAEELVLFLERYYQSGLSEQEIRKAVNLTAMLVKEKAEKLVARLVLSSSYKNVLENKNYVLTNFYMYISASKNGSQYLDSLGGVAGVSASGSYTCNTFLLEAEERREESL